MAPPPETLTMALIGTGIGVGEDVPAITTTDGAVAAAAVAVPEPAVDEAAGASAAGASAAGGAAAGGGPPPPCACLQYN